jgi:hypothetical protein
MLDAPLTARGQLQQAHALLAEVEANLETKRSLLHPHAQRVQYLTGAFERARLAVAAARNVALKDPNVTEKPDLLIAAEEVAHKTAADLEFAQERLRHIEAEIRSYGNDRNIALREVRSAAQAVACEHATVLAARVQNLEAEALSNRIALRGLVAMLSGQGVRLEPEAAEVYRQEYPPAEPVINSLEWHRERRLADEWRAFVEAALEDPAAPIPEED